LPLHELQHRALVTGIEADQLETRVAAVLLEERRQVVDVLVGHGDLLHRGILQQVVSAGRALEPGSEYQHPQVPSSTCEGRSASTAQFFPYLRPVDRDPERAAGARPCQPRGPAWTRGYGNRVS